MTFAQVGREHIDREFFAASDLMRMLRIFRLFDVAVDAQGQPLEIPAHLLAAERASQRE